MGLSRPLTGRSARAARVAAIGIGVASGGAALYLLTPLGLRAFVRVLEATLDACVWLAASLSAGMDTWTLLATIGRAAAGALAGPGILAVVGSLLLVGGLALYGLQRLLGSKEESS